VPVRDGRHEALAVLIGNWTASMDVTLRKIA
jgi:hypothetical protein